MLLIARSFKSCGINNALEGTEDSMKMIWFGTTTKNKKQKMKKSRLTTSSRQTAQPRMTSCLSFVYSFTGIYLHIYFSLALIIREIWVRVRVNPNFLSYISLRENTRL